MIQIDSDLLIKRIESRLYSLEKNSLLGIKDQFKEILLVLLEGAIQLEHSTIPPYLTALFSIKPGSNKEVSKIIGEVAREEMLHMMIASNIYVAYGGIPIFYSEDFIPKYPGELPLIKKEFKVGLEKVSKKVIEEVFMEIERPNKPLDFPTIENFTSSNKLFSSPVIELIKEIIKNKVKTIGDFYKLISFLINVLESPENPNPDRQVIDPKYFGKDVSFVIKSKDDALRAIEVIVEQGEGTPQTPEAPAGFDENEIAHYYKFQQIIKGKELKKDVKSPNGFSFSGEKISLAEEDIYNITSNLKRRDLINHPNELKMIDDFNQQYSSMLKNLEDTYNTTDLVEKEKFYEKSIVNMHVLGYCASKIVSTKSPLNTSENLAPTFEFKEI